jgi:hypothetical protein
MIEEKYPVRIRIEQKIQCDPHTHSDITLSWLVVNIQDTDEEIESSPSANILFLTWWLMGFVNGALVHNKFMLGSAKEKLN